MCSIPDFYKDRTVFITGGTGFVGKCVVEKLLRSCPCIKKIYLLIRPKRGKGVHERLDIVLNSNLFDTIKVQQPNYRSQVAAIAGDIQEASLGISPEDLHLLINEVSIVFHSAATVKFDEALKLSIEMNVSGVHKIVQLCHQLKHLEALVHVSTAYANCDKTTISEDVYPPPLEPRKLLDAIEWMDAETLDKLTPKLLENADRPNTYTFTKSVAESLLFEASGDMPVAIVRPSIVGGTEKEPIVGWVDNFNGPTGLLCAIGNGILRSMLGDGSCTADLIPVDHVAKAMIAVAWSTATEKTKEKRVYHCTTGEKNRFLWGVMETLSQNCFLKNPVHNLARLPKPKFTTNAFLHEFNVIFDHYIPAYLMDFFMWITGKKRMFVKIQNQIQKSVKSLDYFTTHNWNFVNENVMSLMGKMNSEDKMTFNFDPTLIDWPMYMEHYCLGTQKFLLKQELSELPKARRALKRLQRQHLLLNIFLIIAVWRLLINRVPIARSLWNFVISWALRIFQRIPRVAKSTS